MAGNLQVIDISQKTSSELEDLSDLIEVYTISENKKVFLDYSQSIFNKKIYFNHVEFFSDNFQEKIRNNRIKEVNQLFKLHSEIKIELAKKIISDKLNQSNIELKSHIIHFYTNRFEELSLTISNSRKNFSNVVSKQCNFLQESKEYPILTQKYYTLINNEINMYFSYLDTLITEFSILMIEQSKFHSEEMDIKFIENREEEQINELCQIIENMTKHINEMNSKMLDMTEHYNLNTTN